MLLLRTCLGAISMLLLSLVAADGTPAGSVITNQARASYIREGTEREQPSNPVATVVTSICSLSILPDGSLDTPAHELTLEQTGTLYLPYRLSNTGNATLNFDLQVRLEAESTSSAERLEVIWDQNANERFDTGEPSVSALSLAADESLSLLVAVSVSASAPSGDLFVNLVGACAADPNIRDDDNISHIIIPLSGFSTPTKTADPETGSVLYPGAAIRYTVAFKAEGPLRNVVVRDVLSDFLAPPSELSDGLIDDPATGLSAAAVASYDPISHSVSWRFAEIPTGMTVTLELATQVREDLEDLAPETVLGNTATVQAEDTPETPSNTVEHDLRPIVIDLTKTAAPLQVGVGDTLSYTLQMSNPPRSVVLETVELRDLLPADVKYQPGTARVTYPDGRTEALEPSVDGQDLVWTFSDLAPAETLSVSFGVMVLPTALYSDDIVNQAQVLAQDAAGQAVADAAASVATVVELGVFEQRALLTGTAFVDGNDNGLFDRSSDTVIPGLRLYLSNGASTVTDAFGRYTFQNLEPSLISLRVDTTTAPNRFFARTPDEDKVGLWRIRLVAGVITQLDIPFAAPDVRLDLEQLLNVVMGPVTLEKRVAVLEEGLEVQLVIQSSQALSALTLRETLPASADLIRAAVFEDGNPVPSDDLTLTLGDVTAGYEATIRYRVAYEGRPEDLLLAPEFWWDVR